MVDEEGVRGVGKVGFEEEEEGGAAGRREVEGTELQGYACEGEKVVRRV